MSTLRVVMDLSTSIAWRRPPVGIVRTEQKIASCLRRQNGLALAFCRYDKASGVHVEMTQDEVDAVLNPAYYMGSRHLLPGNEADQQAPSDLDISVAKGRPGRRRLTKWLARQLVTRLPPALQPNARDVLRDTWDLARRYKQLAIRWWRRERIQTVPDGGSRHVRPTPFAFGDGDVYLSAGLDWDHNSLSRLCIEKRSTNLKSALFCYDIVPVLFPELTVFNGRQQFARYLVDLAHAADVVITISATSSSDFRELMSEIGGPMPDVRVVTLGTDIGPPPQQVPRNLVEFRDTDFVLCVGTIEARKNHALLYNIWNHWMAKSPDAVPVLVLVGMRGWGVADLLHRIEVNPAVRTRIRILDHVSDEELAWLYASCAFTVYPSLYEGWGLPVSESLAAGKPCICSNAPAILEAAGGLARCIDPLDFPAWFDAVVDLYNNPAKRSALAAHIRRGYTVPTWDQHGARVLAIVKDLVA
jgi:glycosyltransferase involved in cell wall biosynthesis